MKSEQLTQSLLFTGSIFVLIAMPVRGEKRPPINVQPSLSRMETSHRHTQLSPRLSKTQLVKPSKKIRQHSDKQHPFNNAQILLQPSILSQAEPQKVVEVSGIQVNPTEKGIEIILETPLGEKLQVSAQTDGNSYSSS